MWCACTSGSSSSQTPAATRGSEVASQDDPLLLLSEVLAFPVCRQFSSASPLPPRAPQLPASRHPPLAAFRRSNRTNASRSPSSRSRDGSVMGSRGRGVESNAPMTSRVRHAPHEAPGQGFAPVGYCACSASALTMVSPTHLFSNAPLLLFSLFRVSQICKTCARTN